MTYQEEEKIRLRRQTAKQAIALAMEGRWEEAVTANNELLESFPDDVDAYNRLGRAYTELGQYSLARGAYERTLKLDPYNTIAQKNVERLSHLKEAAPDQRNSSHRVELQNFVGEVGKSGVVNLYHLAPSDVLARTVAGGVVNLRVEGPSLIAENSRGEYLGQVEARHALRLIKLMDGGNRYSAAVVSASLGAVSIIIREAYQHPSQAGKVSFPPRGADGFREHIDDRRGDRMLRREMEHGDTTSDEAGYTIIGGDEEEVLAEEPAEIDDDSENEE